MICEDYDRVVVYGDPSVLTTAQELELDSLLGGRMRHVGYLGRGAASRERSDTPSVLVTVGGGGDGQRLLRAYASAVRQLGRASGLESQVSMGPFLAGRRREQITELFRDVESTVNFVGFEEGLERRIGRAWGVVAMGGYNTTMELLDAEQQALVMPRTRPRLEQAIRASRLSGRSGIEAYLGHRGADARILEFLKRVLEGPVHVKCDVALDGLDVLSQELADVAGVTATDLAKGGGSSADAI